MSTLRAKRGDSNPFRFTCVDSASAPLDLTNFLATFTVRRNVDDEDAVLVVEGPSDALSAYGDPVDGLLDMDLAPADTSDLLGDYRFDLEVLLGDSVWTVDEGVFMVKADVTRDSGS
jgi:hypothetical protein